MSVRVWRCWVTVVVVLVLVGAWLRAADAPVSGIITTVAGTGTEGFSGDSGAATSARLNGPGGLAVDSIGNVYIADSTNNRVRKLTVATGVITTMAGSGSTGDLSGAFAGDGGLATSARLWGPTSLAIDSAGNLYIADRRNHRIRKVTAATGIITTIAGSSATAGFGGDGGAATSAQLSSPYGVAVDSAGHVFIADYGNNRVRRVDAVTGLITTIAGTGTAGYSGDGAAATSAQMFGPAGIAVDADGHVYIGDTENYRVRRIHSTTGVITTVAGTGQTGFGGEGGPGTSARVDYPIALSLDGRGNLLIVDSLIHRVRSLSLSTGLITTVAGNGAGGAGGDSGLATAASLTRPGGAAVDASGNIYVGDSGNHKIRKVATPSTPVRIMSTLAGNGAEGFSGDGGAATAALLTFPYGVAVDSAGHVYIADAGNARVRRVDASTGVITTIAGIGGRGSSGDGGQATAAAVEPSAVAVDAAGNLFLVDRVNRRVRKITAATGIITTVAGTGAEVEVPTGNFGQATAATFVFPSRVAVDGSGHLFITDRSGRNVRRVDASTGIITTVAGTGEIGSSGDGGPASAARFMDPVGIAVDASGNLYISDVAGHRVRKVTAAGIISTIAGTGTAGFSGDGGAATAALLNEPTDVAVDGAGNVYVADYSNRRVRMIDTDGVIHTVAGSSTSVSRADPLAFGGDGGAATAALMRSPIAVAVDSNGSLYVADEIDYRVRRAANPAQFTTQPVDQSVVTNAATTFTAAATGSPAYQWQVSTNGGLSWTNLTNTAPYSGVTTGTLAISSAAAGLSGARYRAAATTPIATSYSVAALLTVSTPAPPSFTTQPAAASIAAGQSTTFTVAVSGTPTPTLQWQVSTDGGSTFSNLSNASPYSGVTTATLSVTAAPVTLNGARYRAVATSTEGTATSTAAALTVRGSVSVSSAGLAFQAVKTGTSGPVTAVTPSQTVTVAFAGAGSDWTVAVLVPWMTVTNGSGTGAGQFTVSIASGFDFGASTLLSDVVTVHAPNAPNLSVTVPITLRITNDGTPTAVPIGQVDTPVQDAAGVQGAIGVTGWTLDDVGVTGVKIYRNCLAFEPAENCQTMLGHSVVFIGDAAFLAGARPDVESAFSTYPAANRAGWGYLLLTPMLPHVTAAQAYGGVGPLTLYAVATDVEGNQKLLGRSSDPASTDFTTPTAITMANDTIAKPFGAIDTPGQGATVSGVVPNFGWVLTPDSNTAGAEVGDILVPVDGSRTTVFIDGVAVAQVAYNQCRGTVGNPVPAGVFCNDDVANIFGNATPQPTFTPRVGNATRYRNLDAGRGAIGAYDIDTRLLSNGLHTIAWGVRDSAGREEGIGSRFFLVLNAGADEARAAAAIGHAALLALNFATWR